MKISTSIGQIWREYSLDETEIYAALKRCSFDCVDYDFDVSEKASWRNADAVQWGRDMRACMLDVGVEPVIAHISAKEPFKEAAAIAHAIRCAGSMGIKNAVIPLGARPDNSRAEYEQSNCEYLRGLLKVAEDADVALLIEHCGAWHIPHYTHNSMELIHMMEKLNMPSRLRANLNVAHLGVAELHPYPEISLLGPFIANVDAADNFGGMPLAVHPEREELGLAPMMGYIDYDRVMQGLKSINYDGVFNLRMDMPRVFEKYSPYRTDASLGIMPREFTERLYVFSRHLCEHMLATYGFAGGSV